MHSIGCLHLPTMLTSLLYNGHQSKASVSHAAQYAQALAELYLVCTSGSQVMLGYHKTCKEY